MLIKNFAASAATVAVIGLMAMPASAQKKYGPGVTDTEIKIGQTMPYSGPASAYGTIGKAEAAYFKMVNDQGGVNGRKINFISLDDGYSPPKTVEQNRKLVEQENVLLVFNDLGTPTNTAIHKYMNAKKVPHLFLASGASKWNDAAKYPWTMGWQPSYATEGVIYAKYILAHFPNAKIGVLYQNDDFGKDYLDGFKRGLGTNAKKLIVREETYETSDPTVDSEIVALKGSGADVFFEVTTPKFAAQAIRKVYDVDWRPTHFLTNVSNSIAGVLKPAGFEKAKGIISTLYEKDPSDSRWKDDAEVKAWNAWMDKYQPDADKGDLWNVQGYATAATLVHVLKACGDDLTRENVMKQAASLKDFKNPMLLPGILVNTSATDYAPIEQMNLEKFDGKVWVPFGEVISG